MKTKFIYLIIVSLIFLSIKGFSHSFVDSMWPKVFDVRFEQKGSSLLLHWKADAEPKEIYYEIETSTDAVNYKSAVIVLGGFSKENEFSYLFKIKRTNDQKVFIRIKQINNNGLARIVSEQSY